MHYLLQDLLRLPIDIRLKLIEEVLISSMQQECPNDRLSDQLWQNFRCTLLSTASSNKNINNASEKLSYE